MLTWLLCGWSWAPAPAENKALKTRGLISAALAGCPLYEHTDGGEAEQLVKLNL